jgi:hypothetical protein
MAANLRVNPFFANDSHGGKNAEANGAHADAAASTNPYSSQYKWMISADKIFSSEDEGLEEYTNFFKMEFCISRVSVLDGAKSSDSIIMAQDVKVYLPSGSHCAMIQSRLANGQEIAKITLKKLFPILGKFESLEEIEFSKCIVQSFERQGEMAAFTFRYTSYKDTFHRFKSDGSKKGTAATSIDLVKWEVKDE